MTIRKLGDILLNSLKETFSSTLGKFLFGSFGSIAAIIFFWKNLRDYKSGLFFYLALGFVVIIFSILFFRFVKFLSGRIKEYYRELVIESLYGNAIIFLKNAFSFIHYLRKVNEINEVEISEAMLAICDSIKSIFETKTKGTCGVSIKVPLSGSITTNPSSQSQFTEAVRTICRDSNFFVRDTEMHKKIRHAIVKNTPLLQIVVKACSPGSSYPLFYVNNDIRNTKDYLSTSRETYPQCNLPYNSQLVIPIMPIKPTEGEKNKIAGFLSIDCAGNYTFGDKYDLAILEGIADGLYDVIMRINDIIK